MIMNSNNIQLQHDAKAFLKNLYNTSSFVLETIVSRKAAQVVRSDKWTLTELFLDEKIVCPNL